MTEPEIIAALRLQSIPNIGDVTAKKLISHCGSPTAVFEDKLHHLLKIDGIGKMTLKGLYDAIHLEEAQKEFEFLSKEDITVSYFMDDGYPTRLKHCVDGPILLFQRGNINLQHQKVISVVGTRNVTNYGTSFCNQFIEEIAPLNPIIVSGLAYGVDIAVQKAAMDHGLQTIACMAHGLNQIYPKVHSKYKSKIEGNGGFMTEFWSSSQPNRENFLKRNRIIAGISEATIVIESAEKGGSLVTADLAHGYHREVFAVPGRAADNWSNLLGWEIEEEKQEKAVQKQLFIELDETEQSIYSYLQLNGKQLLDTVALECNLPIFKVSSTLLNMEMKGVIRPLPGKMFEAV